MKTLKNAVRIITQMKAYSVICVMGLVISLAGTLTLVRYIHQEMTVDNYIDDLDRIYLLGMCPPQEITNLDLTSHRNRNDESHFQNPLNHPAIESYSSVYLFPKGEVVKDKHGFAVRAVAADSLFLELMPCEVRSGKIGHIAPGDILISEELADRIFGKEEAVGQPLTFGGKPLRVSAVMKTISGKASLDYDVIVSDEFEDDFSGRDISIIRLHRGEDLDAVNAWQPIQKLLLYNNTERVFRLIPLKESYFNPKLLIHECESMFPKGDKDGNYILIVVAILLFVVGLFNYWNLYSVIMQKRGKEFGVRKVFGAGRMAIFRQLYAENFLLTLVAALLVCMVIEVTDRLVLQSLDIPVQGNLTFDMILGLGMLFGFPLITMLYPYFRYVYSRPVSSMRGVKVGSASPFIRSFFLAIQYVVAFSLIVVSVYFAKQLNDMANGDLGFNIKDIIRCVVQPEENLDYNSMTQEQVEKWFSDYNRNMAHIKHTLNECPDIVAWTANVDEVWKGNELLGKQIFKKAGTDNENIGCGINHISNEDIRIYGLEIVEGREWLAEETGRDYVMLINETAKRELGITDIVTEQVQTKNRLWNMPDRNGKWMEDNPPYRIVGVVKDYITNHLERSVKPQVYLCTKNMSGIKMPGYYLHVRHLEGKQKEVLQLLSNLRNEVSGEGVLTYSFLEDELAERYENDRRIVNIYSIFATLAIIVSCLGLFGLSLFEIRLRYREIALRKVHGAKVSDVVGLLFKRYLMLLTFSALIAIPLSAFFIQKYMEEYAYRTSLSWWIFVLALGGVAAISVGVLFWQINKASNINPAEIMKSE